MQIVLSGRKHNHTKKEKTMKKMHIAVNRGTKRILWVTILTIAVAIGGAVFFSGTQVFKAQEAFISLRQSENGPEAAELAKKIKSLSFLGETMDKQWFRLVGVRDQKELQFYVQKACLMHGTRMLQELREITDDQKRAETLYAEFAQIRKISGDSFGNFQTSELELGVLMAKIGVRHAAHYALLSDKQLLECGIVKLGIIPAKPIALKKTASVASPAKKQATNKPVGIVGPIRVARK